jgi:hypothetical protein
MVSFELKMAVADMMISLLLISTKHMLIIDYSTYIEHTELIIHGERDYSKITGF